MGTRRRTGILPVIYLLLVIVSLAGTEKPDLESHEIHVTRSTGDEGTDDVKAPMSTTDEKNDDETSTLAQLDITSPDAGNEMDYWFNILTRWLTNYNSGQQTTDTVELTSTTGNDVSDQTESMSGISYVKNEINLTQNWISDNYPINLQNETEVELVDITQQLISVGNNTETMAIAHPVSKIGSIHEKSVSDSGNEKVKLNSSTLHHSLKKRSLSIINSHPEYLRAKHKSNDELDTWPNHKNRWYNRKFHSKNKILKKQFTMEDKLPAAVKYWLMQLYQTINNKNNSTTEYDSDLTDKDNLQEIFEVDYETVARVHVKRPRNEFDNGQISISDCGIGKQNDYTVKITFCEPVDLENINFVNFGAHNNQNDMYQEFQFKPHYDQSEYPAFRSNFQFNFSVSQGFGAIQDFVVRLICLQDLIYDTTVSLSKVSIINTYTGCEQHKNYPKCTSFQLNDTYRDTFDSSNCSKFPTNQPPVAEDTWHDLGENNVRPETTTADGDQENPKQPGTEFFSSLHRVEENSPNPIANVNETPATNDDIIHRGHDFGPGNVESFVTDSTPDTTCTDDENNSPIQSGSPTTNDDIVQPGHDLGSANGESFVTASTPDPTSTDDEINSMHPGSDINNYEVTFKTGGDGGGGQGNLYFSVWNANNESSEIFKLKSNHFSPNQTASFRFAIPQSFGQIVGFKTWFKKPMTDWNLESINIGDERSEDDSIFRKIDSYVKPNYVFSYNLYNLSSEMTPLSTSDENPRPRQECKYDVIFETGNEMDAGSENELFFVVFNRHKHGSREFRFQPEDGQFRRSKKHSFSFKVPREFGPITEFQVKLGGKSEDNWKLDSVHISDHEAGSHHHKRVGRYLSPNSLFRYFLHSDIDKSYIIDGFDTNSGPLDTYVVVFQSGNASNRKFDNTVNFKVFNEKNEESDDFEFQRSSGEYLSDNKESFRFSVPWSFGNITKFEIMQTNNRNSTWMLESVTLVNQNTDCSQSLKISDNIQPNYKTNYTIDPSSDGSCEDIDSPSSEDLENFRPIAYGFVMVDSADHRKSPNHMYTVTFQSGNQSDGSAVDSVNLRVFDSKTVSRTFHLRGGDGVFSNGLISFNFSVPSSFGMLQQFEVVPVSKTDFGGWHLDMVTIADANSGIQSSTPIQQYLNMNQDYLFDISPIPTDPPTEPTTEPIVTVQPVTVGYSVTFENGDTADIPGRTAIYLTMINPNNETSPEFRFQHQDGGFLRGTNETFPFLLLDSFGDPVSFRVRADDQLNTDLLGLKSITITRVATGKSWTTSGAIHGGYQYIFQQLDTNDSNTDTKSNQSDPIRWTHDNYNFPVENQVNTDVPDGPDYVVTFLTSNKTDAGSVNPIIFRINNDTSNNATDEVVLHFSGGFETGTNRSFAFTVPDEFGTMQHFSVGVDWENPNFLINDSWILESMTLYNNQSHREWPVMMNLVMNSYTPGNSSQTETRHKSESKETNSTTVVYTCDGTNTTETDLNDYTVTLSLSNVTGPQNNTLFAFGAFGDRNQSTDMLRYMFSNENPTGSVTVMFGFSVPRGFGPILGVSLRLVSNLDPLTLKKVEIDNNISGRKQIREIEATIVSGSDYAYDIPPITCQLPTAPPPTVP